MKTKNIFVTGIVAVAFCGSAILLRGQGKQQNIITGQAAFADWNQEKPGTLRKISLSDLPEPAPAESVKNQPHIVARPKDAWPVAPAGYKVTLYAGGDNGPSASPDQQHSQQHGTKLPKSGTFQQPRFIMCAPNGDLFVSDSAGGAIVVLRGVGADGKAAQVERFATGLDHPFGIAFYPAENPRFVYVANTTSVVRFAYKEWRYACVCERRKRLCRFCLAMRSWPGGGHWTRDVVFSKDGEHMLVSVGSGSNIDNPDNHPKEFHRANVLEFTPEGKFVKVYASGLRNCVGEAINPATGMLWCSTNERDELGNHLVPDYVTSVPEGGFFGWPWYYMGGHQDPRLPQPCVDGTAANPQAGAESPNAKTCKHVDMHAKVLTPDVLLQPHMASLEMTFYPAEGNFPQDDARRRLRRRTRLVESRKARRLRSNSHPHAQRKSRRQLRRFSNRLRSRRQLRLGPPRRHHHRQRRQHVRHRRRQPHSLAHHLRRFCCFRHLA